ncbi:FAD-dependent oxidoreductase [Zeaxanthinibacter sp. PT1]|uniref:NAD(P)/FAD-dependent oxidoreductase n=1 Tax=Zeaxanthinibacter TaxID=561554 RepID=UPI00234A9692|nr:FAD-dependent oxidoreductase [Zeaxanthinibacter sp. PT1]MDC6351921.1 FAD-dependent oxidoreductase [Zeaxanthinibacter sp. PT1]
MSKHVLIIGGGIVGLSCAYYALKDGHKVTILDRSDMSSGASYVNAGYLTPSHIIPLSSPGMMAKGLKYMLNGSSPFYMKPRWDMDFFRWIWQFNKSATQNHVEKAIPLIRDINLLSKDLFTDLHHSGDLGDFQLEKKGLLMLYKTRKEELREKEVAKRAGEEGLEKAELNREQLLQLQPNANKDVLGAVHYLCDGHTTPNEFMKKMKAYLREKGVQIKTLEEVQNFKIRKDKVVAVETDIDTYPADEFVIASGAWSEGLFKKLGLSMHMQAGKGYRINVQRDTGILLPAVLMEAKVAVTPMRGFTRFAGTMEFSGLNHVLRKKRIQAIARAGESYYDGLKITDEELSEAQCGLRPVTPDGLPYIGRTSKYQNITIATGHAMMGWSLGPATGLLVSEIIGQKKPSMNMDGFMPERKF